VPAAPVGPFLCYLFLLEPVVELATARPGQTVRIDLPFMNTGPLAAAAEVDVFVLGPQGTAVGKLPRITFTPGTGVETTRTVRWVVPETAATGSYGFRVFAWDPNNFVAGDPATFLICEDVLDVFSVVVPEVAPEVVLAVAPPAEAPSPLGLLPGDLTLLEPVVELDLRPEPSFSPGETVTISLPFMNTGPLVPAVNADVFVGGPQRTVATLPRLIFTPEIGVQTARTVQDRGYQVPGKLQLYARRR